MSKKDRNDFQPVPIPIQFDLTRWSVVSSAARRRLRHDPDAPFGPRYELYDAVSEEAARERFEESYEFTDIPRVKEVLSG